MFGTKTIEDRLEEVATPFVQEATKHVESIGGMLKLAVIGGGAVYASAIAGRYIDPIVRSYTTAFLGSSMSNTHIAAIELTIGFGAITAASYLASKTKKVLRDTKMTEKLRTAVAGTVGFAILSPWAAEFTYKLASGYNRFTAHTLTNPEIAGAQIGIGIGIGAAVAGLRHLIRENGW